MSTKFLNSLKNSELVLFMSTVMIIQKEALHSVDLKTQVLEKILEMKDFKAILSPKLSSSNQSFDLHLSIILNFFLFDKKICLKNKMIKISIRYRWSLFRKGGFDFWDTGNDLTFNSTFVLSSKNFEESFFSPIFVPWVGNKPVRSSVFNTPSDDFDGMSSQRASTNMMIDTWFIGKEIAVNAESSFNWTVSHDFGLNLFNVWWNTINAIGIPFVLFIASSVNTWFLAFWSWLTGTAWLISSGGVVITWGEIVRLAVFGVVVKPSSNKTWSLEVIPGTWWVSTVASVSAWNSAACQQVFSWDSGLKGLVAGNTDSVTHGFGSTEGPAWSTGWLISNFLDWFTFWPLGSWEEFGWDVLQWFNFLDWELVFQWGLEGSHQSFNFFHGSTVKIFVVTGNPMFLKFVDFRGQWLLIQEDVLAQSQSNKSEN